MKDNRKGKRQLCGCGCGKEVIHFKSKFLLGHHNRIKPMTGKKNPFYGKTHTKFAKECIRVGREEYLKRNKL